MKLTILILAMSLTGCKAMQIQKTHAGEMLDGAMALCASSTFKVAASVKETGSIKESIFDLICGGVE